MNISSDFKKDVPTSGKQSGAYEWWYFDAISEDGNWGLVIIFYQGNPFSPDYIEQIEQRKALPDDFPALSISVYNKNKTEYYSFKEYPKESFTWDENQGRLTIDQNEFQIVKKGESLRYELKLKQELPSGHEISGLLSFESGINETQLFNAEQTDTDDHFWNLVQPRASVTGSLALKGKSITDTIEFNGYGYHDHNVGLEPMKDSFIDWYWGRIHFKKCTLIYYVMNGIEGPQYEAWLINEKSSKVMMHFDDIKLDDSKRTYFGLTSARRVCLKAKGMQIIINQADMLDNGPFYQRFKSSAVMIEDREKEKETAIGYTEYIRPERIYNKIFWPAVRMRLRSGTKAPHWVQKSKFFYEWTW